MKIVRAVGFFPKIQKFNIRKMISLEFCGCLVVRILGFDCHGLGSDPGQGIEIPQSSLMVRPEKKEKEKQ